MRFYLTDPLVHVHTRNMRIDVKAHPTIRFKFTGPLVILHIAALEVERSGQTDVASSPPQLV